MLYFSGHICLNSKITLSLPQIIVTFSRVRIAWNEQFHSGSVGSFYWFGYVNVSALLQNSSYIAISSVQQMIRSTHVHVCPAAAD